jgi:hypothetical protein
MRVNLYTDAPHHNLALMQLSTGQKSMGNEVTLNMPVMSCDFSYASILFEKNKKMFNADLYGGPAFEDSVLTVIAGINIQANVSSFFPDYSLYPIDYSLGYTFRPCFRKCPFCKVWKMNHPDCKHHSIREFHNPDFVKICLLNNNTFFDDRWKETFEEIWDAGLVVVDQNGYDLRLMDEEKAAALKRTRFSGKIHYAWDRMQDEKEIINGLKIAPKGSVYVLIGYDTTEAEDIYRVQKIVDHGFDPYIMPYHQNRAEKRFKRFIDSFMWRKYKTIQEAWGNYKR